MSEWQTIRLGNIIKTNENTYSQKENWKYVNYLDTGNITKNRIDEIQYINTVTDKLPSRARRKVKYNSIIYSTVRPNQLHFGIIKEQPDNFLVSTGFVVIDIDKTAAVPDYVYYILTQEEIVEHLHAIAEQSVSTYPSIKKTDIENLEVVLPDIDTQKRTISVLQRIDDKIELNNKINNNLEEQIKVLYKYYFTDAKNDNWPEVNLSDLIFFQEGPGIRNWQYVDDGVKFINIRCITNGSIDTSTANKISTEEAFGKYSHFLLKPYDIVMSCSGTLGRYAIVQEENLPLCLNTSVIRFRPLINEFDYSFVYGYLSSPEFLNQQTMMANGSAQVNFGPTHLRKIIIKEPPVDTRKQFNELIMPIINKIICTRTENARLAALRDTLLPKLMSGEIDVSNITI